MKKLYIIGLMVIGLSACKPNVEPLAPSGGSLDVSRYLAVGNSLTAGVMDGSLYREGQENSFPAILNKQFETVQYVEHFKQPLLPGEHGYPNAKLILAMRLGHCDNIYKPTTVLFPGAVDSAKSGANVSYLGPYNNVAVPGIRVADFLTKGFAMNNIYASRFFAAPTEDRPIDEAMRLGHTIFTLWIGSHDVMNYAQTGGEGGARIANIDTFRMAYDTVITHLTKFKAKGVVLNIPEITALPYFTTISPKALTLTKREADDLNNAYNNTDLRFKEGGTYFLIEDTSVSLKMRLIRDNELVLLSLPLDSVKCAGWGSKKPIPARYILTANEIAKVKDATAAFNQIIQQFTAAHDLPLVDMYAYTRVLQTGVKYNGAENSTKYISGSAFSLDGLYFTPRGYAIVANEILRALNNKYGSTLPLVDVNNYRGNYLP